MGSLTVGGTPLPNIRSRFDVAGKSPDRNNVLSEQRLLLAKKKSHGIVKEKLEEELLEKLKQELRDLSGALDKDDWMFRWAR